MPSSSYLTPKRERIDDYLRTSLVERHTGALDHLGIDTSGISRAMPKVTANLRQRETLPKQVGSTCMAQGVRTGAT